MKGIGSFPFDHSIKNKIRMYCITRLIVIGSNTGFVAIRLQNSDQRIHQLDPGFLHLGLLHGSAQLVFGADEAQRCHQGLGSDVVRGGSGRK